MAGRRRLRAISHEDELSLVDHLDELRTRIVWSLVALVVVGAVCFWQNHWLLDLANAPLPGHGDKQITPATFGVTEPFMTTLTVVGYAALIVTSPFLLYQAYAFVLPAFTPNERGSVTPFLLLVPVLFLAGVVFAYFVVTPSALHFLLQFNDSEFNIVLRAREYYSFIGLLLFMMGVLFQLPIGILAAARLGIVTPKQLSSNRRYAVLGAAIVAMLLPGQDPVTMLLCMLPLYGLYELSIVLARLFGDPRTASTTITEPDDLAAERS